MSEDVIKDLNEKMDAIQNMTKAPSQNIIFFHLLSTGRTTTVREISSELSMTPKATERAVAKLLEKGLIQRAAFRQRSYSCDSRQILLALLIRTMDLQDRMEKRGI